MKLNVKDFDFRPAPFWFLNHELDEKEIIFQLDKMKDAEVSGFFLHPRAGNHLQTYGSKEWFEKINFIVKESKKRNLKVWLYDEDPFPSGVAGGRVFLEKPQYKAHKLTLYKATPDENGNVKLDFGKGVFLCAYAIKNDNGKIVKIDISESVGTVRGDYFFRSSWDSPYYWDMMENESFPHMRAETQQSSMAIITTLSQDYTVYAVMAEPVISGKYGGYSDLLNPKCIDKFIELTHEKYKKFCGKYFGSTVLGIFTDEPQICGGYSEMFSFTLFKEFKKNYGYDLKEKLIDLFENIDFNSCQVRYDYRRLVENLLQKNFYKKIYDWCKKNNIYMTGHLCGEEALSLQPFDGQNFYKTFHNYWHIPGMDFLGHNLGDNDHFALTVGGKSVSSAASQAGLPVVLCEFAACNPYNYTIEGLERVAYYQWFLGANFLVPHGYHFSLEGFRKFDAGCSFNYQFKDFDKMKAFNLMAAKFSKLLAESENVSNVLVVMPYNYSYGAIYNKKVLEILSNIVDTCKKLTNRHIEYDLVDDLTFANCAVKGKKVKIGKKEYSIIIAPKEDLTKKTVKKLKNTEHIEFEQVNSYHFDNAEKTDITALNGDCSRIMVLKKKIGKNYRYFIFNSGFGQVEFSINIKTNYFELIEPYKNNKLYKTENGIIRLVIDGGYAIIIEESTKSNDEIYCPSPYTGKIKKYEFMTNPELDYVIYDRDNFVIENYDMDVSSINENFSDKLCGVKYGLIRERFGTLRDYMKTIPIPAFDFKDIKDISIYPVKAKYTARFTPDKKYKKLLIESTTFSGTCKIYLNGNELDLNKFSFERVYDFHNKTLDITDIIIDGENNLVVDFDNALEFDGITSRIYLIN